MRKAFSIVGAALIAASTLVTPVEANHYGTLSASCGAAAGAYGDNNITDEEANNAGSTVPAIFYQVQYSNIPDATTLGVLIRYNDEINSQVGTQTVVVPGGNGSFVGRYGSPALIDPANQGGGFTAGLKQGIRPNHGGGFSTATTDRISGAFTSVQVGGGILPGDYHFYVYAGEIRDMPESVKDGPAGPRFIADESKFIGKFSCGADA